MKLNEASISALSSFAMHRWSPKKKDITTDFIVANEKETNTHSEWKTN